MLGTAKYAAQAIAVFLVISGFAFAIIHAMPADPVLITLIELNIPVTAENEAALRAAWGLDRPLPEQYVRWLWRFLGGDWGNSFRTDLPILSEFVQRLPYSATIGFGGLGIAVLLSIPLGFASARRPRGFANLASRALSVGGQVVPSFWLGLVLLWFLAVELRVIQPFFGGPAEQLVLPTLLVAIYSVGSLARVFRNELLATTSQQFFRTALAKGLTHTAALRRHGMRHAFFGYLAALVPEFAWAVGGTAVVEIVFAVPGISLFLVESIAARDYFVLQAYVMVIAVWMLLVHAVSMGLRRLLDPRIAG